MGSDSMQRALSTAMGRLLVSSIAVALSFVTPSSVWAQPTPADKESARTLMDKGDEKRGARDYKGALRDYQGAHDLVHVPTTGIEVAKTLESLGQLVEARDMFLWVTRYPRDQAEPAVFTQAREEAEARAIAIEKRISSLVIHVEAALPNTHPIVKIDGIDIPSSSIGIPRRLNPGFHVITASAGGHISAEKKLSLREGESSVIKLSLAAEPTSGASPLVITSFSIAGLSIVAGTVTGVLSLSAASRADEQCPQRPRCPLSAKDDIDLSIMLANVSNVGFALGAVGTAIGIYGLVRSSSPAPKTTQRRLIPIVGYGRIIIFGEF